MPDFLLQAALNGYQLDKAHKVAACLYDEFERLAKVGSCLFAVLLSDGTPALLGSNLQANV